MTNQQWLQEKQEFLLNPDIPLGAKLAVQRHIKTIEEAIKHEKTKD